jgi:hypothetical protein
MCQRIPVMFNVPCCRACIWRCWSKESSSGNCDEQNVHVHAFRAGLCCRRTGHAPVVGLNSVLVRGGTVRA